MGLRGRVASVTEVEGNHTMNSGSQGASGLSLYGTSEQGFQSIRGAVQKSGPCFSVVFFLRRKKSVGELSSRATLVTGQPGLHLEGGFRHPGRHIPWSSPARPHQHPNRVPLAFLSPRSCGYGAGAFGFCF